MVGYHRYVFSIASVYCVLPALEKRVPSAPCAGRPPATITCRSSRLRSQRRPGTTGRPCCRLACQVVAYPHTQSIQNGAAPFTGFGGGVQLGNHICKSLLGHYRKLCCNSGFYLQYFSQKSPQLEHRATFSGYLLRSDMRALTMLLQDGKPRPGKTCDNGLSG